MDTIFSIIAVIISLISLIWGECTHKKTEKMINRFIIEQQGGINDKRD